MARFTLALSLALAALAAGEASAAPLTIVSVRRVEIGTTSGPIFSPTSNAAGTFSEAVAHPVAVPGGGLLGVYAAQVTLVDGAAGLLAGTGSASVDYSVLASDGIYADSVFDVSFDLAIPHGYALVGDLAASSDGGYAMDNGGVFQEGAYMGGSSAFDVEFQLTPRGTPVAEPLSLTLLAVGFTLVAWRRGARI